MKTLYDVVTEAIDPEMKKRKDYLYRKIRNAKLRGKDTTDIEKEYNDFLAQYKNHKLNGGTPSAQSQNFDGKKLIQDLFKNLITCSDEPLHRNYTSYYTKPKNPKRFYDSGFKDFMQMCKDNLPPARENDDLCMLGVKYSCTTKTIDIMFLDPAVGYALSIPLDNNFGKYSGVGRKVATDFYTGKIFSEIHRGGWETGPNADWVESYIISKDTLRDIQNYISTKFRRPDINLSNSDDVARKWIKLDAPCTHRYGMWNEGNPIPASQAQKLIDSHKYSWEKDYHFMRWKRRDNGYSLAFIDSVDSDMY